MDYFPLFIKLHQQPCLVVGGGEVAARKIELLARAGAKITVVAHCFNAVVIALQEKYQLTLLQTSFSPEQLQGFQLVVCATNDEQTNRLVADSAKQLGIWVNVVDNPTLCNFIFPAIVDRNPLIIAISSGGSAPVLARLLRAKIETLIAPAYGKLAYLAETFRETVKQRLSEPQQRRIFWENVFQGHIAELVFAGHDQKAKTELQKALSDYQSTQGEVYLIGAGPGAADLLTLRAVRLMQQADVIVHDRLVSDEILELARRDAQRIYVGKQRSRHTLPQEDINQLLVDLAQEGKRVARLKGGDPFIFGRGGEEIETLIQHGISFQVVPGITAASGCSAYGGIPLTHRDHAQSCIFVTGHLKDNSVHLNWTQLAMPQQTVVIYMGLGGIDKICQSLIAHGSSPNLPAAVIQDGTTIHQRITIGTLTTLPQQLVERNIKSPSLIIIGTVVNLHDKFNWFAGK